MLVSLVTAAVKFGGLRLGSAYWMEIHDKTNVAALKQSKVSL